MLLAYYLLCLIYIFCKALIVLFNCGCSSNGDQTPNIFSL